MQTPVNGKEFSIFGQGVIRIAGNDGQAFHRRDQRIRAGRWMRAGAGVLDSSGEQDGAKLGQPEVKLGILPGYGGITAAGAAVRKRRGARTILTGEMISAEEAMRIGLVNHIYEPAELLPAAEAMAKKIIANAPLAVNTPWKRSNAALKCRRKKDCSWRRRCLAFVAQRMTCAKARRRFWKSGRRSSRGSKSVRYKFTHDKTFCGSQQI